MSTSQRTATVLNALVIRNTFLELKEEGTVLTESRCRSISDYTDARRIRSWSNCSEQNACGHPFKNLEAVMEGESDTDAPDEEEVSLDRFQSSTDEDFFHTSSSSMSLPDLSDEEFGESAESSMLNVEMLAALEGDELDNHANDEHAWRARARTSSTLFWFGHDAHSEPQVCGVDDASSPKHSTEPEQMDAKPSACTDSNGVQSNTCQNFAAGFIPLPQEVYLQSFVPAYMGSLLPQLLPVPMPWYAYEGVSSSSSASSRSGVARDEPRKAASSSSLELSLEEEEQGSKASKKKKKKQRHGARHSVWQSSSSEEAQSQPTTVMLRNLPNRYTRKMFLQLLDIHGFASDYNFVYLPIDFNHRVNLGYAFVNLASHEAAVRLIGALDGFKSWAFDSQKVCEAVWSSPHQGLTPNIERYRNSPVMHESVSDEFKPLLFKDGARVAFPPPTKSIRAPKARDGCHA